VDGVNASPSYNPPRDCNISSFIAYTVECSDCSELAAYPSLILFMINHEGILCYVHVELALIDDIIIPGDGVLSLLTMMQLELWNKYGRSGQM